MLTLFFYLDYSFIQYFYVWLPDYIHGSIQKSSQAPMILILIGLAEPDRQDDKSKRYNHCDSRSEDR